MSLFDRLAGSPEPGSESKPKEPDYIEVTESSLECQTCHEDVSEGKYYPGAQMLVWVCSSGHKSFIEDIEL